MRDFGLSLLIGLLSTLTVLACAPSGTGGPSSPSPQTPAVRNDGAAAPHEAERDPDDPTLLPRPFTADQIRNEWVKGLEVTMRRWTTDEEMLERWTVVSADAEGVDIASTLLDTEGHELGEPRIEHSTWVELRDHASFPADLATREAVTLQTPLGELQGWLYTVRGEDDDTVTTYFFASRFPGAPVEMRVELGGVPVQILEQIARSDAAQAPG